MKLELDTPMGGEDIDNTPLTFGKYKGDTPDEISEHDPGYIIWMAENIKEQYCSDALYQFCQKAVKQKR